ncbi:DUF6498-containing protein [Altibacter sp. HG106]|uniref:DUF6498-containing protein n=1 Tax=Altibacter sp. HG106 TaxID=3023937 RepID=UPI002350EEA9|nr:DUF6498-containing protein [Altibacter sp. HG106]MDC7994360.1 DUF6498-containing protein [Altibacter sp. HG106]
MKAILLPNKYNAVVWAQAVFFAVLVALGIVDALTVLLAYFLETIIVGMLHVIKLAMVNRYGKASESNDPNQPRGIGLILFFIMHYGFFVAIQSIFMFGFFEGAIPEITSGFNLIENYSYAFRHPGIIPVLASIIVTNVAYFITNFIQPQRYKEYRASELLMKPYVRIFVQQFAVILGGFFFVILQAGTAAAVFLILFRLGVDLVMVALRKNGNALQTVAEKLSKTEEEALKMKRELERFSE